MPRKIQVPTHSGWTVVWGLWRHTTTSRVVQGAKKILGKQRMLTPKVITKKVPQHAVNRLRSEGYKDGWQCQGSGWGNLNSQYTVDRLWSKSCEDRWHAQSHAGQENESWYTIDGYADGCPQDNSSIQWIDFSLKAMKTDGRADSCTGVKLSPKCMMHNNIGGHHWDNWLHAADRLWYEGCVDGQTPVRGLLLGYRDEPRRWAHGTVWMSLSPMSVYDHRLNGLMV